MDINKITNQTVAVQYETENESRKTTKKHGRITLKRFETSYMLVSFHHAWPTQYIGYSDVKCYGVRMTMTVSESTDNIGNSAKIQGRRQSG